MGRIGIYGGTFNPPHRGHMQAARQAVELLNLDKPSEMTGESLIVK